MLLMHAGDQRLRCDAFLFGAKHNRRAVRIVGTDVGRGVADQILKAHPNVGLNIFDQVTEVNGAVGVRQGGGNEQ